MIPKNPQIILAIAFKRISFIFFETKLHLNCAFYPLFNTFEQKYFVLSSLAIFIKTAHFHTLTLKFYLSYLHKKDKI